MSNKINNAELLNLTTSIVTAHVSRNVIPASELPDLIKQIHGTLANIEGSEAYEDKPKPAVPINRSVTPDYIICLEDGRKMKMLKRHLKTTYNMTPEEYRKRWSLPSDYPLVAPNYAKKRSSLAKKIGLGKGEK